ncbi:MAG: VanW family protein [Acidimicrobiales bacterium]|nr:VanW family protein [Acidimicrobiales bacterium]
MSVFEPDEQISDLADEIPEMRGDLRRAKRRRGRRIVLTLAVVIPVLLLGAAVAAWAVDTKDDGRVVRNVTVAGVDVGTMTEAELTDTVAELADEYQDTPVTLETPERTIETTVGELGARVDQEATVAAAMEIGRDGSVVAQPVAWWQSFLDGEVSPVVFRANPVRVEEALVTLQGQERTPPVEPGLELVEGRYEVVPGVDGEGIDPADILTGLNADGVDSAGPDATISLTVENKTIPPRFPDSDAEALAVQANDMTDEPLQITAGGETASATTAQLQNWISAKVGAERLKLKIDKEKIKTDLPLILPAFGEAPVDASFTVGAFGPEVIPGRPGTGCCAAGSAVKVATALRSGETSVQLELGPREPDLTTEEAEALGIVEEITLPDEEPCNSGAAEGCRKTTHHNCCEGRNTNINRMADLVRGYVIMPGGQFSINEVVGPRTVENGFVAAGAIENGVHVDAVGGGVSQFATTSFNAAFFAGLDIPSYQFHTEHISRYPYGRESTVSYPQPNFIIENNTPYGVLLWPTYTDTSITMTMYSTRYAVGAQTGQSTSPRGSCTDVTTTRTRTFVDGRTENDTFHGYYRNAGPTC